MKSIFRLMLALSLLAGSGCFADNNISPETSIENLIQQIEALKEGRVIEGVVTSEGLGHKCGTHLFLGLLSIKDKIDPLLFKQLLERPQMQTFFDTDHFRIHYDTIGAHAPYQVEVDINPVNGVPDYIDSAAAIFEYVWFFEVDSLGYPPPNSDDSAGGNAKYDIYVSNLSSYYYGLSQPDSEVAPGSYTSFIQIQNDYTKIPEYQTRPYEALQVTAAHEFFHSIHFTLDTFEYDGFYPDDKPWWYEVTAVWMEDVVFDEVDDYKLFTRYFYNYPWLGLGCFSRDYRDVPRMMHPYAACIWARFLQERFDIDVIRQIWLECGQLPRYYNVLPATDNVLASYNSSFEEAFLEFASWNFFTGVRADTINKFSEADEWPLISIKFYTGATPSQCPVADTFSSDEFVPEPLGANYLVYRTSSMERGGLQFAFDGNDIYTGNNWLVGVLGWEQASDTLEKFYINPVNGVGFLSFRDWTRYDSLIVIPTVFGLVPGYTSYGYSLVTCFDENLVGNAPLFCELPDEVEVMATSCVDVNLRATDINGDAIHFYSDSDTLEGLSLFDYGDGNAVLTYCPPMEIVGHIVPVRVFAADTSGYDAEQVVFYIISPTEKVSANMFPNPIISASRNLVTLQYFLPDSVDANDLDIRIFNVAGELVYKFMNLSEFGTGFHEIPWNGLNSSGNELAGGVYFIKVRAGNRTGSGKFAIIR